jgi:hypothetical protein
VCNNGKTATKGTGTSYPKKAFNDLLLRRNLNNGKLKFGDIENVVMQYQAMGFTCVTQRNLRYRMLLLEKHGS